ncbi:hypothetical protein J4234_02420 [Candidatus Woesearchaeota archaeon]|nr:hypothetical protein [Candidatus Woesearchaeota archaeon]
MDRRAFLAGTSSLGLVALLGKPSHAEVNVSRDFLSNLSTCWERFVFGTDEFKIILILAIEGDYNYFTSYGLETKTVNDIWHSYKVTQLKKSQPLTVWTRNLSDLSDPLIGRADTDLDGKVDHIFVEVYNNVDMPKTPINLNELPKISGDNHQELYERSIRALNRKIDV